MRRRTFARGDTKMKSAFDPATSTWKITWPQRISKHDVVYLSPPDDPIRGMPTGNGDVGVLAWCEDTRIILVVNKSNLWDDAPFGRFENWNPEQEDYSTCLRHGARIIVDFKSPVFDTFYLSDFKGRIGLADATISFEASGPLGFVAFRCFVAHDDGVICLQINSKLAEEMPLEVSLERYGSRTFSHWYNTINRDPSIGLAGTDSSVQGDSAYVFHRLTCGEFAVGCKVVDSGISRVDLSRESSHCSKITFSGSNEKKIELMASVSDPVSSDSVGEVERKLSAAKTDGISNLYSSHAEAWKSFWLRSFMEYGNDYLDNLWHMTMYYANCSQRGKYPGRFISGLWGWNRDVQHWNFYFHWNQQMLYWPLNAAGHHDLCNSYLNYRFGSLTHAKEDSRELFHSDGAFVSDVTERRGYNSAGESANHTPVAEIALDFWRQYRHTCDREFLSKHALPYMLEAARFFESRFELGDDGKYHAKEGTAYEGTIKFRDPITEIANAGALFSAVLQALDEADVVEPRATQWKAILDNLAPMPIVDIDPRCTQVDGDILRFSKGFFKGDQAISDKTLCSGCAIDDQRMVSGKYTGDEQVKCSDDPYVIIKKLEANDTPYSALPAEGAMIVSDGVFPTADYSAVFPSGFIGLAHEGSRMFNAAVNKSKLFAPDLMGHDTLPIVMARLGLAKELDAMLENWPNRWQFYCNGWGHYGPRDLVKAEAALRFRTTMVWDSQSKADGFDPETTTRLPFSSWPFRHMGMESMSILACAMNEALLQSHDTLIRVAPAVGDEQDVRFTLHATCGFVVSAEIKAGTPLWISIRSRFGKTCRVINPWTTAYIQSGDDTPVEYDCEILEFETNEGETYFIAPNPDIFGSWSVEGITYQTNDSAKVHRSQMAILGLPRMF